MSLSYVPLDSPFFTLPIDEKFQSQSQQSHLPLDRAQTPPSPFSFPSSPATSGGFDVFDITAFEDPSYSFDLGTPSSVALISPKSSFAVPAEPTFDVAALSNHHLQRYLHYKSLVEATTNDTSAVEALFGASMQEKIDVPMYEPLPLGVQPDNMMAYQPQADYYGTPSQQWQSYGFQNTQQIPMQTLPQQIRQPMAQSQYYIPSHRSSFDQSFWSHQSTSTVQTASPPYPVTPVHVGLPLNTQPVYQVQPERTRKASVPESPVNEEEDEGEDELSDYHGEGDSKPAVPSLQVANPHGGGRGYVPGKTPDDPKKRHKCTVCGRGFARAFNLKVSYTLPHYNNANHPSPMPKPTTHSVPNPTNVPTPRASAVSPDYTISSATAKVSTVTVLSSTPNELVSHRPSHAQRLESHKEPNQVISPDRLLRLLQIN
jgi:hypothetical protein